MTGYFAAVVVIIQPLPLLVVFQNIIETQLKSVLRNKMSKELLLQHQERANFLQNEEEKEDRNKEMIHDNIEKEIECPRCYHIKGITMALLSDFDKLPYFCKDFNLSLLIN